MYLLDTNVVSEFRKARRNPGVLEWIASVPAETLFLSVITIGEITKGIARLRRAGGMPASARADDLQGWLDGLLTSYGDRVLGVNIPIATRWGRLCDTHPEVPTDMLIAATALHHGLMVATRNVAHFQPTGVPVVNPFGDGERRA